MEEGRGEDVVAEKKEDMEEERTGERKTKMWRKVMGRGRKRGKRKDE